MRKLESSEVEKLTPVIAAAILEASHSPCQKSQRGVVIYDPDTLEILAQDHNRPKKNRSCILPICSRICREFNDHAEPNTFDKAEKLGVNIENGVMLHMKIKDGKVKTSTGPSCLSCSPRVADSSLSEFILYTDSGFIAYGAQEFHQLTQLNMAVDDSSPNPKIPL